MLRNRFQIENRGRCTGGGTSAALCARVVRAVRVHMVAGMLAGIVVCAMFAGSAAARELESVPTTPGSSQDSWAGFARDAAQSSAADAALAFPFSSPTWVRSFDGSNRAIMFVGQSSVAVSRTLVCAIGSTGSGQTLQHWCFAISRYSGGIVWAAPIARPLLDSYSTPLVDEHRQQVIVTTGRQVKALSLLNGEPRWVLNTVQPIVNASPIITDDLGVSNRLFFTDYDGAGTGGSLHCVNIDAFHALANPYLPGQTVWSVVIGGTSGNTPAYAAGRVYVCTAGEYGVSGGELRCYDARAITPPTPFWSTPNPIAVGFFSGPAVAQVGGGAYVYAASYAFWGNTASANLVKIRASDGAIVWSIPSNRTSATPVVLGDGRIVLSTGVSGYGSLPAVQIFRDAGSSAFMLWDSSMATWTDTNANGLRDSGEYTRLGGWSVQPALDRTTNTLLVGAIPTSGSGACNTLGILSLGPAVTSTPVIQPFVAGCGSSPAIAGRNVYSIGPTGLHAFGARPPQGDLNGDGRLDEEDLYAFGTLSQAEDPRCDVNSDGLISSADRDLLEAIVRAGENESLESSRHRQEAAR